MKNKILYISSICLLMFACTGEPDFSNIPEISFNSVKILTTQKQSSLGTTKKDSVILTINFQDGDGDLGFSEDDFKSLVKTQGDSVQTFDVKIFVSKNGKFIRSYPKEKIGGNLKGGIIKDNTDVRFRKGSKSGPIEGTVDFGTKFEYGIFQGIPYLTGKNDTVKFSIQIMDRALNRSNVVETTPVVIYAK